MKHKDRLKLIITFYILLLLIVNLVVAMFLQKNYNIKTNKNNKLLLEIAQFNFHQELDSIINKAQQISYEISNSKNNNQISKIIKKHNSTIVNIDLSDVNKSAKDHIYFSWVNANGYVLIDEYETLSKSIENKVDINILSLTKDKIYNTLIKHDEFMLIYKIKDMGFLLFKTKVKNLLHQATKKIPTDFTNNIKIISNNNEYLLRLSDINNYLNAYYYIFIFIGLFIIEIFILIAIISTLIIKDRNSLRRIFRLKKYNSLKSYFQNKIFLKNIIKLHKDCQNNINKNLRLEKANRNLKHQIEKSQEIVHKLINNQYFNQKNIKNIINEISELTYLQKIDHDINIDIEFCHDLDSQNIQNPKFFTKVILDIITKSIIFSDSKNINIKTYNEIDNKENKNIFIEIIDRGLFSINLRDKTQSHKTYNSIKEDLLSKKAFLTWKENKTKKETKIILIIPVDYKNNKKFNIISFPDREEKF